VALPVSCPNCGTPRGEHWVCQKCGKVLVAHQPNQPRSSHHHEMELQQTSNLAVVAFIATWIIPVVGIVLGFVARNEIDKSGGKLGGRGLATAAIVLGWVGIIAYIWFFAVVL